MENWEKTKGTSIDITEILKKRETFQNKCLTLDTSMPPTKNYTCPCELHETEPQDAAILPGRKWGLPASGLPCAGLPGCLNHGDPSLHGLCMAYKWG